MLRNSLALAATLAVMAPWNLATAEPFRLIVTHLEPPLVPNSVMDLAHELGYFAQEGVEVELLRFEQTPLALAALRAGEGDMANVSVDGLLHLIIRQGEDMRAVFSPNPALPFLIAGRDDIASVTDLKGRTFGVGRLGSLDHSLSTQVMEAADMAPDQVNMVALGQPGVRAQALAAGRIDATTMSIGVWMSIPDPFGLHVIVPPDAYYEAAPVVNKVNAVPARTLEERRDDVVAVVRAITRLSRDFAADPSAWADAIAPYAGSLDADQRLELAKSFGASWAVNGGFERHDLRFTQAWLYQSEDFADLPTIELDAWADFSILEEVLAEIGVIEADAPGVLQPGQ